LEMCRDLVANGANVNQESKNGGSPWLEACAKGHLHIVEFFVENGQNIEFTHSNGYTALIVASAFGKANVVHFLLSKGALIDRTDAKGLSPLFHAAGKGHLEVCREFVAMGANINQESADSSPWLKACISEHLDIVELFADNGQDIETTHSNGYTGLIAASLKGNTDVLHFLLLNGASVDRTLDGFSPLFLAVNEGHLEVCKVLVAYGADANKESDDGLPSPWLIACKKGHLHIVKFFLENGQQQNIDATDRNDATGLIIASSEGKTNVVRFLLSNGARADRTDANGNTALDEAVENGHGEIMELLALHIIEMNG
uniref:ANK_REP_REGION domain-containing protein n=1 Tax=Globodera pallida TaxID=36090 RepID=A0A183BPY1_GLOPA